MWDRFYIGFFNALGGSFFEMAVVFVAILLLFGAKALPETLRTLGKWMEILRRSSEEFKEQLMDIDAEVKEEVADWERDLPSVAVSAGPVRPDPETRDASEAGLDFGHGHYGVEDGGDVLPSAKEQDNGV